MTAERDRSGRGPKPKPRIAVHKFSSCDGCQLAFLNLGEQWLTLARLVDIVHFAEAGPVDPEAEVDIAFVEGSLSTPEDLERIARIRARSRFLVTIGACATAGGLQALRNLARASDWFAAIYPSPQYIQSLPVSTPIAAHVKVDLELWGCPVNGRQVIAAVRALLEGVAPVEENEKLCLDCKRRGIVCVLVAKGLACLGPVTRTGCGALCPAFGRDCYGCYGPAETPNSEALGRRFAGLGLVPEAIAQRFLAFNSAAPAFTEAGLRFRARHD
jgi:coenzyme F420-reducing hydrogenase gamma subunit